jgi:hypothetical protein
MKPRSGRTGTAHETGHRGLRLPAQPAGLTEAYAVRGLKAALPA